MDFLIHTICVAFSLILCELLFRLFCVFYELRKKSNHYNVKNRFSTILKFSFTFNTATTLIIGTMIFLYIIILLISPKYAWQLLFQQIVYLGPFYIILRFYNFTYSRIEQANWIRSGYGLDYATGMASNYFHGYLNFQFPDKGDKIKGLYERIEDYESTHAVTFPVKKLFILIPDSLHIKPEIKSKSLSLAAPLCAVYKNRAGVSRPFTNAVYRIKSGCKAYYVVMEGATPLLSYREAMNDRSNGTDDMKEMQREITLQFYKALKYILQNCPDTRNLCELVYYNDLKGNGQQTDVGEMILERLKLLNPIEVD